MLGLPENSPDVNEIVNSLTRQKLFTLSSTMCPIAQNAITPFLSAGVKTEIPEDSYKSTPRQPKS